jgi:hypothetical protein
MFKTQKNLRNFAAGALALSLAGAFAAAAPATSAPNYDGLWSVVIMTQRGTCDRAYRYPVRIAQGTVVNAGDAMVNVTGRVGGNGAVVVQVSALGKTATAQGRLSGISGGGSWSGGDCAGTWMAEKRGA